MTEDFDDRSLSELESFAEELRSVHPRPQLGADFSAKVRARLIPSWSFRQALRSNRLVRAAALVLITLTGSVPVLAVFALVISSSPEPAPIGFLPPTPPPMVDDPAAPDPAVLTPAVPGIEELLDEVWMAELVAENERKRMNFTLERMFYASAVMNIRFQPLWSAWKIIEQRK
jgi:hypothetical protein